MKNYDLIKKLTIHEMAAVLYMFLKPMFDEFNMSEEQKKQYEKIYNGFS